MIGSEVQLCNNALLLLGAKSITSFTDGTISSNTCRQFYEPTRNELLAQHFWNFAIKRVSLAEIVTTPAFEWAAQYELPSDFVRVRRLNYVNDVPYIIEGTKILTDQRSELQLVYVARVSDTVQFSPLFTSVLTTLMAILIGPTITGDGTASVRLAARLRDLLLTAKMVDSQDGTPENWDISTFTGSRIGSNPGWWETRND
jgi:hypothetical protein